MDRTRLVRTLVIILHIIASLSHPHLSVSFYTFISSIHFTCLLLPVPSYHRTSTKLDQVFWDNTCREGWKCLGRYYSDKCDTFSHLLCVIPRRGTGLEGGGILVNNYKHWFSTISIIRNLHHEQRSKLILYRPICFYKHSNFRC